MLVEYEDEMNEKTVPLKTILQHGPGPPSDAVTEPSQSETQQLQQELRRCLGKLRGYETLNHLYQESVQNCNRFKLQAEELAKQIDNLTRHNSTMADVELAAVSSLSLQRASGNEHVSEITNQSSSNSIVHLSKIAVACSESSMRASESRRPLDIPELLPACSSASENQFSLEEFGAISPPTETRPREKTESSSCTSSPSFVQINSPETDASTSLLSSAAGFGSANQQKPTASCGSFDAKSGSVDMSTEINRLIEHVKNIGSNRNISTEDLAGDLIKAGVGVMTMQKQARIQQVMLNEMTTEIAELKAEIATNQRTIALLTEECASLRDTVRRMKTAREQSVQKVHAHLAETENTRDEMNQDIRSIEWVEVERQHTSETTVEEDGNEMAVTAMPMTEAELRRRVEKLNATINELVSVNRSWDEHCRQLESNHNKQITAMQQKINDLQHRQEESERADQQRQMEFDSILLNSKKRVETEELAKEDALNQLRIERQQRMESEQNCVKLSRKAAQLEQRLLQLQQSNQSMPRQFDQHVQPLSTKEQELSTQLSILQAQVNVYKEDFDNERRDREKAKLTIESLRKRQMESETQTRRLQTQLTQANEELKQAKSQCETWRQRFNKLSDDIAAFQQQARPREVPRENRKSVKSVQRIPSQRYLPATAHTWMCDQCTFANPSVRTCCEMCGGIPGRYLESDDASVTGSEFVAGLQILRPAMPYNFGNSQDQTDQPQ